MRVRFAGVLAVALALGLLGEGAWAASYQKVDGTIVDPILDRQGNVLWYSGPNLEPGMSRPTNAVYLTNADLSHADFRNTDLSQFNIEDADLSGSNLSGASLREARFTRSILAGSLLEGASLYWGDFAFADFSNAVLDGADLSRASLWMADLSGASLLGAYYDANTTFPTGFNPVAAGMVTGTTVVNNGLTPPALANVFDNPDRSIIINNVGCNALIEYPCLAPGTPTTVSGNLREVLLYESSSFLGSVAGGLFARDHSYADLTQSIFLGDVFAQDHSTVVADKPYNLDSSRASASDDSRLSISGGSWDSVVARGRSEVVYAGWGYDGSDVYVSDDAFLDYQGASWGLSIEDRGRAVVRTEVIFWIAVGPDATLELVAGGSGDLRLFDVDGTLKMTGGSATPFGVRVSGYADIQGGSISSEAEAYWDLYGEVPGPWNVVAEGTGLIDLSGGLLQDADGVGTDYVAPRFAARDASRIRLFGSGFVVDGVPVSLGSISTPAGTLTASLANGDPINNPFAHRGADCGGQPCMGRILVLAPGLDWDQDAIPNPFDNCAEEPNADQADVDTDGTGDVCFAPVDLDRDNIIDAVDNCRVDANPDQADADSDGIGDACDDSLVVWTDPGTNGCTSPPQPAPYTAVTGDLANGEMIDRAAQPCDCMGLEFPVEPGVGSVRFLHVSPAGVVKEVCENAAPFAFGLAPGQLLCSTSMAQDGSHAVMVTPYSAPECEAGDGEALPSSIRRFEVPEPVMGLMIAVGVLGLAGVSRRRRRQLVA
jgi:uncharacterized protein YjbI with pentapeptide repeats